MKASAGSGRRAKILWVKAGGLVPPETGGRIRSYNIATRLAERHDVGLFTFYGEQTPDPHVELAAVFRPCVCLPLILPRAHAPAEAARYAASLLSLTPYQITKFCTPVVRRTLAEVMLREAFDVVICDFVHAAGAIAWNSGPPKLVFTHNVEAQIWERHYRTSRNFAWKAVCWREWQLMQRYERRVLRRADHIVAVSEPDRAAFSAFLDPAKITVTRTGVDLEYFRPGTRPIQQRKIVFMGSMDWLPNEDGIFYFLDAMFPRILEQMPDAQLSIVGRKPSDRLRARAAGLPVHVLGRVEDVRPHMDDAAVCIVPLRIGGGTRLKIFEAMAMGLAVVSTSIGAEGLPVTHGENVLLADAPEGFADAVVGCLRDSGLRSRMGAAARGFVEAECGWGAVVDDFEGAIAAARGFAAPQLAAMAGGGP